MAGGFREARRRDAPDMRSKVLYCNPECDARSTGPGRSPRAAAAQQARASSLAPPAGRDRAAKKWARCLAPRPRIPSKEEEGWNAPAERRRTPRGRRPDQNLILRRTMQWETGVNPGPDCRRGTGSPLGCSGRDAPGFRHGMSGAGCSGLPSRPPRCRTSPTWSMRSRDRSGRGWVTLDVPSNPIAAVSGRLPT